MAQNENKKNEQEVVELKKDNFVKRSWKKAKSHGRDIAIGVALGLSLLDTALIVLANINGIEADIEADAIDSASDPFEMGVE